MDTTDWRTQLQPDSRQRIIDEIMETLKRHLPVSSPEGLADLRNIAARYEEKVYTAGTSQSDYQRKISMKMMAMESKSQTTGKGRKAKTIQSNSTKSQTTGKGRKAKTIQSNSTKSQTTGKGRKAKTIQSNSAGSAQNPPDSGQSQIPLSNNFEAWQQLLSQNVENTIANTGVQSSANLPSALPSVTSLTHTSTANAASQSTNMQSVIEQNFVRSSVSQGLPSNTFSNSQYLYQQPQLQLQMLSFTRTSLYIARQVHEVSSTYMMPTAQTGQDAIDWSWRITLRPDSRQIQLNMILETLKKCFPICGSVGLVELNKIAELFEEEIYAAAKSHLDYLQKVYLKILKMEDKISDCCMQSQVRNQGQSQIPLLNQSRTRQQLLSQNTIVNAGVQSSVSLT